MSGRDLLAIAVVRVHPFVDVFIQALKKFYLCKKMSFSFIYLSDVDDVLHEIFVYIWYVEHFVMLKLGLLEEFPVYSIMS